MARGSSSSSSTILLIRIRFKLEPAGTHAHRFWKTHQRPGSPPNRSWHVVPVLSSATRITCGLIPHPSGYDRTSSGRNISCSSFVLVSNEVDKLSSVTDKTFGVVDTILFTEDETLFAANKISSAVDKLSSAADKTSFAAHTVLFAANRISSVN